MTDRRTAIVTGSTSGIGQAIAQGFARAGMNVVLNGFGEPAQIEAARAALASETGVEVLFHGANLLNPEETADLIRSTERKLGAVDVLVNNAGIQHVSPIEDFPIDKWDQIIGLNLGAAFHAIRTAMAGMKARKFGRIVNVASAHALVASPYKSAYVAAKHGIAGLTKVVALEGAAHNVRCNAICPGYVFTPLVEKQIPDTMQARGLTREQVINDVLLQAQPTKEFVKVEDIAGLALFLTSEAANQVNGAILPIDGGWTAA